MKASASSWCILGVRHNQRLCIACLALFFPPEPWAAAVHSKHTPELSRLFLAPSFWGCVSPLDMSPRSQGIMDSLHHGWVVSPSLGQGEVHGKCAGHICGMSGGWMEGWMEGRKKGFGWMEGRMNGWTNLGPWTTLLPDILRTCNWIVALRSSLYVTPALSWLLVNSTLGPTWLKPLLRGSLMLSPLELGQSSDRSYGIQM